MEILASLKPENTPNLDTENVLIAVNGSDSSAMEGKKTIIKNGDVVSIIPVIHGGTFKKTVFTISKNTVQIMEINGKKNIGVDFLDGLRSDSKK
ncbi:MAG: thiamine biosynthesis protein ThiS, partial [Nitrosopumilales archaeon CG15_BIG_FIL_POST_REV_8_21_14_020_37_12]